MGPKAPNNREIDDIITYLDNKLGRKPIHTLEESMKDVQKRVNMALNRLYGPKTKDLDSEDVYK